jgi:hypothetical protein
MRTDPRAAEVRSIVKQAFASFLGDNRAMEPALAPAASPPAGRRARRGAAGAFPRDDRGGESAFPRLYDPAGEMDTATATADVPASPPEIDETILIDQGRYVARSYRAAGYLAMWLVAVGIVQFYDSRGRMLGTINLFESLRPKRLAA